MRDYVTAIALTLLALACGFVAGKRYVEVRIPDNRIEVVDTITEVRIDTIRITETIYKDRWHLRTDTCRLATVEHDTIAVEVPIETRVYADSLYRAQVSGFRPSLDWVEVYPTSTTTTKTIVERVAAPQSRWSVGIQAGVGVTPKGVQPYAGVGIGYRITR